MDRDNKFKSIYPKFHEMPKNFKKTITQSILDLLRNMSLDLRTLKKFLP